MRLWLRSLAAMTQKELTVMVRYRVEFLANLGQVLLIVIALTLARVMFTPSGVVAAGDAVTTGVVVYGFVAYLFLSDTLWTIGYNVRREQLQGTLEQLYLTPASKSASLVSRVTVTTVWTGLLALGSAIVMAAVLGGPPFANPGLATLILGALLAGTFGVGFAFAAVVLRIREAAETLVILLRYAFMVLCAPFFPFAALPDWLRTLCKSIPLAFGVDLFRATLMNYPPGYPELATTTHELFIVFAFALAMPLIGLWLYRREEDRARRNGSLSGY